MRQSLVVIVAAVAAATVAAPRPSHARCANGPYYGYPAYYEVDGVTLPSFSYGGFYTPRVVLAPCIRGSFYAGYDVRYRNVRRSW